MDDKLPGLLFIIPELDVLAAEFVETLYQLIEHDNFSRQQEFGVNPKGNSCIDCQAVSISHNPND